MNKKICFLIVFCLLFVGLMARADSDQSIVVLEPNGGEVWEAGKAYRVIWQATGHDTFAAAVVCGNDVVLSRYNIEGNSYLFNLSSAQVSYSRCKAVVAKSDIGDFDNIELGVDGDYGDANFKIAGIGTSVDGMQSIEDYLKSQADLIKGPDGKLYEVIDGYKLLLPSNVFSALGYNSADADSLTQEEINDYPRLKLAEMSGSVFVYYLTEGGRKRLIPNSEVFDSYNNSWDDVVELEENVLNVFPDVELIRGEGDYKVYKLENGTKRWIKTAEVFSQMRYDWSDIAPVNTIELDTYTEGEAIGDVEEGTEEESETVGCGTTTSLSSDTPINEIDFESDNALVCLGNSFLNECGVTSAVLDTFNSGAINFEIKDNCVVRIEYGSADQISLEEQKQYAGKYIECPIDIEEVTGEQDYTSNSGEFAYAVYLYMGLESLNPDTECVGSLVE